MRAALDEARAALAHDDVPVGAVVVRDGEVIAARHNERELTGDPTAHAEVLALRDAAAVIGHWRLDDCTLVVTLEPCAMCAGAMVNGRLGHLVYGATDPKAGAAGSRFDLVDSPLLNHRVPRTVGVLAEECGRLLVDFFAGAAHGRTPPTPDALSAGAGCRSAAAGPRRAGARPRSSPSPGVGRTRRRRSRPARPEADCRTPTCR